MKIKARIMQIIARLFGKDIAAKDLNNTQWGQVSEEYKKEFKTDMLQDYSQEKENSQKAAQYDEIATILAAKKTSEEDDDEDDDEGDEEGKKTSEEDDDDDDDEEKVKGKITIPETVAKLKKENEKLKKENQAKEAKITQLGNAIEKDDPDEIKVTLEAFNRQHSKTHLFGIETGFFSLEKRWNRLMVNPDLKALDTVEDKRVFASFQHECEEFGAALAKRYQFLHSIGKLPKKGAAFTQTYTSLADAGLGSQFVVIRQDALIARILELPNVYDIFPRRFGVQDRDIMTNAFFGEFSQAWQTGAVWKGSMELKPEIGYVDDAMFKTLFESMKWLERQYIGYLNREGSDPMKWSLIEWTLLQIAIKLTMEQYERAIMGVFVQPVSGQAGHYLHASTGLVYTLQRYIHENKLQVFTDAGLASYANTATNFVDLVIAFYEKLKTVVPNFQESQYAMYLNANHRFWYKSQVRAKYGLQQDFTGPIDTLVPDTQMPIIWVPNMKQSKLVFASKPGNFQALENLPGEMFNIQFQADMEAYKAWSVWKEGFAASFVGKAFASPASLLSNNFLLQEVFMNRPATALAADAATADADANFWFRTINNVAATALTDFVNAVAGVAYKLECGGLTNATTVAKSSKFSEIVEAYTPTALGDYLLVVYDTTATKFFELERCVGGVRAINPIKQPNTPGNGGR